MTAFPPTRWIAHGNAPWVWERGPPDPEGSNSLDAGLQLATPTLEYGLNPSGVVGGFYPSVPGFDQAAFPPTSNSLYIVRSQPSSPIGESTHYRFWGL